jgi:hypothetical protein
MLNRESASKTRKATQDTDVARASSHAHRSSSGHGFRPRLKSDSFRRL